MRAWTSVLAAFAVLIGEPALAQRHPVAGVDYEVLENPRAAGPPGEIELIEFFWFRCPHCYALEPMLEPWLKKLPADVRFRRVPGMLKSDWTTDAQVFYALESIGEEQRLHRPLFDAIHRQGSGASGLKGGAYAKWTSDWLAAQGVDMKKYRAAFESAAVRDKLEQARRMNKAHRVEGVPTLALQGRYVVGPFDKDRRSMLAITDYLIGEARKPRAAGALDRTAHSPNHPMSASFSDRNPERKGRHVVR